MTRAGSELLGALAEAAGPDAVAEHPAVDVDGVAFEASLRPADGAALARALAALSRVRAGVVIRGGGTRLGLGNPPRGAVLLLDTGRLAGVDVFEPGEGVCRAGAGTPLRVLREKVAAGGWELPLDPPGDASTLGGAIASAAFGPRAQRYGLPRDLVLGLDVALARGERTRCGGRVVKNVTGYDLCKLYTGSLGAFGVVEAAWLRLHPRPEAALVLEACGVGLETGLRRGLAAARRATARAAALLVPAASEGDGYRLVVELAGDAVAVERDRSQLGEELAARDVAGSALAEMRAVQGAGELRIRVTALASRLAPVAAALREAGASLLVYPGLGALFARFEPDATHAFDAAAAAARLGGGEALVERAPSALKRGRDVFGPPGGGAALARRLKQCFDPDGILNPGRGAGGS